ncbi:MAG: hypothetical protein IJ080_01865 [Oscillospiraceae bacterium]|nr:hypothetical protein [Oscillospiraceae bacterium]MBQ8978489.1 hypothetical protein [Oscillospiraceae bacterium]
MSVNVSEREYDNYGKCIFLDNGSAELGITVDVGPRIIYFSLKEHNNIMFEDHGRRFTEKVQGMDDWVNYGGHRLWCAPEVNPETYSPDNAPVAYTVNGNTVTLAPKATPFGKAFSLEVTMDEEKPVVTVCHKIRNVSDKPAKYAAWSITGLRSGGVCKIPVSTRKTGYLGNRTLALWDYTDINDPRFSLSNTEIRLRQDIYKKNAFKIGLNVEDGFVCYAVSGQIFVKSVPAYRDIDYPDFSCNFETYTNSLFLECENIGEYREYARDEEAVLTEKWFLIDNTDENEPELSDVKAELDRIGFLNGTANNIE